MSDAQAARARTALWIIASVTAAGSLLQAVIYAAGASITSAIAVDCLVSLAYAGAAATVRSSG